MIASRTYMGEHHYGRRSKDRVRKPIARAVPAIVSAEQWDSAQQVLRSNQIMASRNTKEPMLLRGLIKCGLCGLRFAGMRTPEPQKDHYYRCIGRQFARGLYGLSGKRCTAKAVNGEYVERLVWADIESFLRNPGEIIERLRQRFSEQDGEQALRQKELEEFRERLQQKGAERDRVLGLFRRGRIDESILDQQLAGVYS
jgi:site-specific DNA recombinase